MSEKKIDESVKIYQGATVKESSIEADCTIGDYSKVEYSDLEDKVRIDRNNYIHNTRMGRHSYTGSNTKIISAEIGRFAAISWNVTIGGGEHDYTRITNHSFLYDDYSHLRPEGVEQAYNRLEKPCRISNDVWIASNVVILRGVTVGDGAVIAAGAVVTKDVPPYAIVAGSPAKVIKYRFGEKKIQDLLDLKWWNWSDEQIRGNYEFFTESDKNDR